jgi:hypothetical protein
MGAEGIRIDPVVRIQLVTPELVRLLDAAEPLAHELKVRLPEDSQG